VSALPLTMIAPDCELPSEKIASVEEEAALVERAKTDPQALTVVYRRYEPRIAAYVVRRIGRTHEAEDVVASVFLAMVRGLASYRAGQAPFVAWLYRIASNEINRSIRKRRIRSFFGLYTEIATPAESTDEAEQLRVALSQLPLHYQTALSLHYLEDLSINEVAAVVGSAPGTVKSRLARGRELLKARLSQIK
jgi:RNA polymerase sigma-70 factor, ECF subfamily